MIATPDPRWKKVVHVATPTWIHAPKVHGRCVWLRIGTRWPMGFDLEAPVCRLELLSSETQIGRSIGLQ